MNRISFHWLAFERFFFLLLRMNDDNGGMRRPPSNLSRVCFFPIYLLLTLIKHTQKKYRTMNLLFRFGVVDCSPSVFFQTVVSFLCRFFFQSAYFFSCPFFSAHTEHRNSCSTPKLHGEQCEPNQNRKSTRRIPFHLELLSNFHAASNRQFKTYVRNLISVLLPAFVVGFQFQYPENTLPNFDWLMFYTLFLSLILPHSYFMAVCERWMRAICSGKISVCVLCATKTAINISMFMHWFLFSSH